jgi:hypothetical protein
MAINKQFLKDTIGWGLLLWLIGYILGIIFFMVMPPAAIGWIITPLATLITLWVLVKKIKSFSVQYYLSVGIIWTALAVILDYLWIVKAFNPKDGYYKLDVYLYYSLTLILPVIVGLWKQNKGQNKKLVG